jgi:ketosteroid isomerase-like protein
MPSVDHAQVIREHWEAANRNDFDTLDQLYHDDFVMDLPQSGERMRGKAKIRELRSNYPTRVRFATRRVVGDGDTWVWEGTVSYNDGTPMHRVSILEFRDGRIARETNYFGDSFPAAEWRAQYVEPITDQQESL